LIVIGASASNGVDEKLASLLNVELIKVHHKIFPDGESYVRIPKSLKGADVVIVQSTYPPQDKHLIDALITVDAAYNAGANRVILAIPYLAYARQDRMFISGEGVSIKVVLKAIKASGVYGLIVVDLHKEESLKFFNGKCVNVTAIPELAEYIKSIISPDKSMVLAPDIGALERAKMFALEAGISEWSYLRKTRDKVTGEITFEPVEIDAHGKTVIIVDDIISTGGTVVKGSKIMYEQGAREVYAVCTHPLLVGNALDKLFKAGVKDVVATDSIPSRVSKVSVAKAIARGIESLW